MRFYIFVKGCSIIAPLALEAQAQKLDATRKALEANAGKTVQWVKRNKDDSSLSDVYEIDTAYSVDFFDALDTHVNQHADANDCEVYW